MQFYEITDGHQKMKLQRPTRLPQVGDKYILLAPMSTLAGVSYRINDTFVIVERTTEKMGLESSIGQLRIQCKWFTSLWTSFDDLVARHIVELVVDEEPKREFYDHIEHDSHYN